MKKKINRIVRKKNRSRRASGPFLKPAPNGNSELVHDEAQVSAAAIAIQHATKRVYQQMAVRFGHLMRQPAAEQKTFPDGVFCEEMGRYGVGDYVTRDGTDVHVCISMPWDRAFHGTFRCVVASSRGWCQVDDEETNSCHRYDPVDYDPAAAA